MTDPYKTGGEVVLSPGGQDVPWQAGLGGRILSAVRSLHWRLRLPEESEETEADLANTSALTRSAPTATSRCSVQPPREHVLKIRGQELSRDDESATAGEAGHDGGGERAAERERAQPPAWRGALARAAQPAHQPQHRASAQPQHSRLDQPSDRKEGDVQPAENEFRNSFRSLDLANILRSQVIDDRSQR